MDKLCSSGVAPKAVRDFRLLSQPSNSDFLVSYKAGSNFPTLCRLHCRKEYDAVWKGGRKIHVNHFLIIVLQKKCGPTRLGLTVSRKIGGAVARNRLKRLLREYFRLSYNFLPPSIELLIVAKKGAASLTFEGVSKELDFLKARYPSQSESC